MVALVFGSRGGIHRASGATPGYLNPATGEGKREPAAPSPFHVLKKKNLLS
jgi:hypothetical protein